jgi:hypothetical protein
MPKKRRGPMVDLLVACAPLGATQVSLERWLVPARLLPKFRPRGRLDCTIRQSFQERGELRQCTKLCLAHCFAF